MAESSQQVGAAFEVIGTGFWSSTSSLPSANMLGPRVRGRASLLTLMFAEVMEQAVQPTRLPISGFATIFGSAFGEMERLIQLLETMQSPSGDVSPLRFQTSVHNAAAGQISIVAQNPRFSTSLAAGHNTVAMSFVEAACWMQLHEAPLLLVMGDEASPAWIPGGDAYAPVAAAVALAPSHSSPSGAVPLRLLRADATSPRPDTTPPSGNPCAKLAPLVEWLATPFGAFHLNDPGTPGYVIERT